MSLKKKMLLIFTKSGPIIYKLQKCVVATNKILHFALDIWFDVVKILINDAADAHLKPQTESLKV